MQVELLTKYECIQKSSPYPIEELPNLSSYLGTSGNRKSTLGRLLFMRFFCALHSNTENKTTTTTTTIKRTAARTTNGTRKKS